MIRAASGAGKTTLLRSWTVTRRSTEPLVWLSITAPIESVETFWTHVGEAARRSGDLAASEALALVRRLAADPDPTGTVIEFMASAGKVTLVLDAYEKVGDAAAAEIDRELLRLTEELPDVRVVVATRGGTSLVSGSLQVRDRVQVIDDRDLALTHGEVKDLMVLHLGEAAQQDAKEAADVTGGYALAVRALILAISAGQGGPAGRRYVWGDLVAADLRSQLPNAAIERFVALTSVPPYFDAVLAERLAARHDVSEILSALERQGFGRWLPHVPEKPVFQYVDAVRDTFRRDLLERDRAGHRRAAATAARWFHEQDDHEAAFEFSIVGEDYELAVEVFVSLLRTYPESYATDRLVSQLERLPQRTLRTYPMLAFALGLAQMANPLLRTAAPGSFRIAARQPIDGRILGLELDRFVAAGVRAVSLRLAGRFEEAARHSLAAIAELDPLSDAHREALREPIAMILRQLSYSLLQGGRYDDALAAMVRSTTTTTVRSTRNYALAYVVGASGYLGHLGHLREASAQIDDTAWPRNHEESYLNAMNLVGEGYACLDDGDPEAALERVRKVAQVSRLSEFWPFVTAVSLHANLSAGRGLTEARRVEELLTARFPPPGVGDNVGTRTVLNLLAISWTASGRLTKAERILGERRRTDAEVVPARLVHALVTGRADVAVERLATWLALDGHTPRTRAATQVLGAAAALRIGDGDLARALVHEAFDLHRHHGLTSHLDLVPAADRLALGELVDADPELVAHLRPHDSVSIPDLVPRVTLSRREHVVLSALLATASREHIAAGLSVSANTVKSQLRSIYRKLGVTTRAEALRAAIELDLISG
ncbi:LuxR C-terminal-related transcriptional regulator [Occultella kanbiaonis]|uniref:LuxR C-terminal-related transcriptional regulator n=1 Tax=Occultella kanbiaonis TaxID=2675754 RepID=UPI0013CFE13F|nr:LuxR C-terminal-related transcriptional regulator [Occultella kanbiaonis]